jgi:hypothetical protein
LLKTGLSVGTGELRSRRWHVVTLLCILSQQILRNIFIAITTQAQRLPDHRPLLRLIMSLQGAINKTGITANQ